jgi:hypothetical protein
MGVMVGYYFISAACGSLVACAEVVSRYRDEPLKAICCWWGLSYIVLNALLSVAAYAILSITGTVSSTMATADLVRNAILAGFGAAVVMRAKIFNLRLSGGERVSFGPDFVIDTFLNMLDRQIDRRRAYRRSQIVMSKMEDISFEDVKMPMVTLLTSSMQNLTASEELHLGEELRKLTDTAEFSNQDKSYALGFLVMDLAGEDFFKKVFTDEVRKKYLVPSVTSP